MGKTFRQRVLGEKGRLEPEMVFTSDQYQKMLKTLSKVLTDSEFDKVMVSVEAETTRAGCCGPDGIVIYVRNPLTRSFPTIELKNRSIVGILAHECGHKNYSSLKARKKYLEGIKAGLWYPRPPIPESAEEKESLKQMKIYFQQKNRTALQIIELAASSIQNVLEDVFGEELMCSRFVGSISHGIRQNRERKLEMIPSLKTQIQEGYNNLSIMINLIVQYALSGNYNNWDGYHGELLEVLESAKKNIDDAIFKGKGSRRIMATNQILLKMWKILRKEIEEVEKQQEETEAENEGKDETSEGDGDVGNETTGTGKEKSDFSVVEKAIEQILSQLPDFVMQAGGEKGTNEIPEDVKWDGSWEENANKEDRAHNEEEREGSQEEKEQNLQPSDFQDMQSVTVAVQKIDMDEVFQDIIYEMAKEAALHQCFHDGLTDLQRELQDVEFQDGHKEVQKVLKRGESVEEVTRQEYEVLRPKIKRTTQRLKSSVLPILQAKENRIEHKLFMGKKIDGRNLTNQSGKIFQKKCLKGTDHTCAVAILLDLSCSMSGSRIRNAKVAALCMYEFCRMAQIPVTIYGHHTDGSRHSRLCNETVFLHSCAEFVPDDNDRYRILQLKVHGANRDGAALLYMGEKLLKRTERQKILVLISDGLPNASFYNKDGAKQDLIRIKKNLEKKGVSFLAAAIGDDKNAIEQIYQESFLDISDLERMPAVLSKKMLSMLRRR